ncbi:50S ribosome-binding GTPase [Candidatus Woesearchaeota archaeon]|nr:50S ribosome-binding GTPase [Candidatus Woesearchaeota archaeon]
MNFQYIPKIDNADQILDIAFRAGKESYSRAKAKHKKSDPFIRLKNSEHASVETVARIIEKRITKIVDYFPMIDDLPDFYRELMLNSLDTGSLKKSITSLKWCSAKITELKKQYLRQASATKDKTLLEKSKKGLYGRISSIIKKNNDNLIFLDSARKVMKKFPDIKTDIPTIAITGYPNVGKSSLLKAITGSDPKIASYAFTTLGLNTGYIKTRKGELQLVDAPGTFDRDRMNPIEMKAVLAIKHIADLVIFMIDPSESCGYSTDEQLGLLKRLHQMFRKDFLVLLNKSDLIEKQAIEELMKEVCRTAPVNSVLEISTLNKKNLRTLKSILLKRIKDK